MNDKDLREAVEFFANEENRGKEKWEEAVKHSKVVIDLAERYLDIEGFPEEKECHKTPILACYSCHKVEGYNQALRDCKLAHLKNIEEKLEGVLKVIRDTAYKTPSDSAQHYNIHYGAFHEKIAESIKAHFRREK
jgi:hypothetical protein